MKVLLYSGILYLTGVAIVLFLRPQLMFHENGSWKEFGIGRDPLQYTWMPIWLFCILWAIISYLLVILLADAGFLPGLWVSTVEVSRSTNTRARSGSGNGTAAAPAPATASPPAPAPAGMKPGYYMLNTEGSGIEGVPKYIYLGPAAPGQA
jgi:hypothetical protein